MTNALATTENRSADLIVFDNEKIDLIKRTVAVDATDDELALFMHQAKRMGLDPLARQIHFQKYNTKNGPKVSFITTVDGYRLVADRTGRYAGNSEPVFEGTIKQVDWGRYDTEKQVPAKATVIVKKVVGGVVCEFSASVYWEEYYPGGAKGHMWRKMPHVMLAKCAEAAALRKAFPADLSGVYTNDEMGQSEVSINQDNPQINMINNGVADDEIEVATFTEESEPTKEAVITAKQVAYLNTLGRNAYGDEWDEKRKLLVGKVSDDRVSSSKDLTQPMFDKLKKGIQGKIEEVSWELVNISEVMFQDGDFIPYLEEKGMHPLADQSIKSIEALILELKGSGDGIEQPELIGSNGNGNNYED